MVQAVADRIQIYSRVTMTTAMNQKRTNVTKHEFTTRVTLNYIEMLFKPLSNKGGNIGFYVCTVYVR